MFSVKTAVDGIYNEGKVVLNENINIKGKARVLVVFLDDSDEKRIKRERLLNTFGSWHDNRTSDQIIQDIYNSRVSRKEDIIL